MSKSQDRSFCPIGPVTSQRNLQKVISQEQLNAHMIPYIFGISISRPKQQAQLDLSFTNLIFCPLENHPFYMNKPNS